MIQKIEQFIHNKQLFSKTDRLLLAISGGTDSVALFDVLTKLQYHMALAHCNFQLRGSQSDADEQFVAQLAQENKVSLFVKTCNANQFAHTHKLSVEMAARQLRYNWFDELMHKHQFDYLITAHQANDLVETLHINLMRGSGIRGLSSLEAKNGYIVRPMLQITRSEIETYIHENTLLYQTDSSNQEEDYLRNKIRHRIIPQFQKIKTNYIERLTENIFNLHEAKQIYNQKITEEKQKACMTHQNEFRIHRKKLLELNQTVTYLFEFIAPYGFNAAQANNIVSILNQNKGVGKQFLAEAHRLIIDREYLIVVPIKKQQTNSLFFKKTEISCFHQGHQLQMSKKKPEEIEEIATDNQFAYLDDDQLHENLELRNWKEGDYFYPLGLKGKMKLKKFFADRKFSLPEKEQQLLLCSAGQIVWVVGKRIDDRFKITPKTQNVLIIELCKNTI